MINVLTRNQVGMHIMMHVQLYNYLKAYLQYVFFKSDITIKEILGKQVAIIQKCHIYVVNIM